MADAVRKRAVEEAADRIREDILTGRYRAGEHLPGERELSTSLGISRLTLRSAIARLEAEGLVRAVHGSGNLVQDYRESGTIDLLGYLAQLALDGRVVPVAVLSELLELRRALAVEAVGLVAERSTEADRAALRAQHRAMTEQLGQPRAFVEADLAFARRVVRATHNIAFELVFNTVQKFVAGNPALELAFYANAQQTVQVYARLLDLIERRDARRARQVTSRLLERLDRRTLGLLSQALNEPVLDG
jgi:DNA-binding FadR family transcriptional regulator